jgi:hypothetical protein
LVTFLAVGSREREPGSTPGGLSQYSD